MKHIRRLREKAYVGRELEMEEMLHQAVVDAGAKGRRLGFRWFLRKAKQLCRELYPERTVPRDDERTYLEFRFSNRRFQGVRKRYGTRNLRKTKQAQRAPEDFRAKVECWKKFNQRHTVVRADSLLGNTPEGGAPAVGRFKPSEITNMEQTPITFELLDNRTYDFKGPKTVWLKEIRPGCERDKRQALPVMVQLTRSHPAIAANSAASDRAFSIGGDIVTKKRDRLHPCTLKMLICLKNWAVTQEPPDDE